MADPTRDQLMAALRKADAANDTEAARAIARRIADMDAASGEGLDLSGTPITDTRPAIDAVEQGSAPLATFDFTNELGKSVKNTAVGLVQGAASLPDLLSFAAKGVGDAVNFGLTEGGGALLDVLGADRAAERLRQSGQEIRALPPPIQIANALERQFPTEPGFGASRFGAQLLGGALVPLGPKATPRIQAPAIAPAASTASAARRIISEGQKRGVPVMTTDVIPPNSGAGRAARAFGENIPLAGTSGPRAAQQAARQDAVRQIVEEFGGDTTRAIFDDSDTIASQVTAALVKSRGDKISRLTTAKRSVIEGVQGTAPVPRALKAIDDQIAAMVQRDTPASRAVADILRNQRAELSKPRTLEQIEAFRADELSQVFGNLDTPADIKTVGERALRKIYDPLRQDMGDIIEAASGKAARAKWARANGELSALAGELDSAAFRSVLRQADITPDKIKNILFSPSADPADIKRLVSGLDDAGRRKVQGALLTRAWERAGGGEGVSVERFLNNLKSLSNQIGVAFQGADRESIEGVRRLLEATRRASAAGVKDVPTGVQNAPTILGFGAASAFGAKGGAGILAVGGLLARLYESAAMRNLLIGLSKTKTGSPAEQAVLSRIMRAAPPVINNWQDDLARAVNDNLGAVAAAEPTE